MLQSNICNATQLKSTEFQRWMSAIGQPPMVMHRKLWEWAYICQALEERGMLVEGSRGLGFAVGTEPLVALFASKGCQIVATDLDETSAQEAGWTSTNQHARDLAALNSRELCEPTTFADRVSFRVVNMHDIPADLRDFDFVWSSCAIEHLGDIKATEDFMSRMMGCLKPGGIAVHTTEYNLTSDRDTVEVGPTIILRRSDLESMVSRLEGEGHCPEPIDFNVGDEEDDKVILSPPYEGYPCLKIWLGPHAATSVGLIVRAGDEVSIQRSQARQKRSQVSKGKVGTAWASSMKAWLMPTFGVGRQPASARKRRIPADQRTAEDVVRDLYRLLLGREPDPKGHEYHSRLMVEQGASAQDVARMLVSSVEFAAKSSDQRPAVEVELGGYSIFARESDRDIGSTLAKGGAYEPHVAALIRRELRAGDTFLDVGANIGFFSMLAAYLVGPAGKVVAVEPMDKNLQLIYLSIEKNAFENVEVFPFGASDRSAIVPIVTDPNTSNALVQTAESQRRPSLFAPTRTLDWMCADLERLDFVKMDIEGHEMFAWRGAKDILARFKPRIATEFHPLAMRENAAIDCRDYVDLMFGYCRTIQVIVSPDLLVACSTFEEVMAQWEQSDERHGGSGSSHLDLFLSPRV